MEEYTLKVIARIHSDFHTKFGIPRQSGLIPELTAEVVFEPEYRKPEALRGLEEFSHIWLIWEFSEAVREDWSSTVRPPRLGGNRRVGVFASRSPFRPNAIGLSSVRLLGIEKHPEYGEILLVSGADLMDGTPIFDIKPYLPQGDCHPEAAGGFTDRLEEPLLQVDFPEELLEQVPEKSRKALLEVLAHDARPGYQRDEDRIYGLPFGGFDVKFQIRGEALTVLSLEKWKQE
ncbi:MAG TPA: tRNA (N6-threonylcarbamoyladenosine(37)-N6)-methyltransferase TrmO [Candidatus Scatomonas merdigallinarum]|nr:tRNA (N6-threonylcarbamoyladenosine(37)-N6)-methyltransferase TrmO [Candidatus Scatomonas merdigallinarum]